MYSLHLTCQAEDVDALSADLWEFGTAGIRELESGDGTLLIAGFETNQHRLQLFRHFVRYQPKWEQEDATDWVAHTHQAWPPREVGKTLFLSPPWFQSPTPEGRVRLVHNPGLACGTGEHPCTQLALAAIESNLVAGTVALDIGTGSAMLAIAALLLGAGVAIGIDTDGAALVAAKENFELNHRAPMLAVGSADCIQSQSADLVIANISGTVLLAILDDLLRITRSGGKLILTGFPESELAAFKELFPNAEITGFNEWRCLVVQLSSN